MAAVGSTVSQPPGYKHL